METNNPTGGTSTNNGTEQNTGIEMDLSIDSLFEKPKEKETVTTEQNKETETAQTAVQSTTDTDNKSAETKEITGVEIEGVKYGLDAEGNAIDDKGNIVKTKTDVDALAQQEQQTEEVEEIPLITEVYQKIGVELLGDDGKPKVYEDSVEGMSQMALDIAEKVAEKDRKEFFTAFPIIKELTSHLIKGGTPEEFFKTKSESWRGLTLKDASDDLRTTLIIKDLTSKGMNSEQAQKTAKLYKDSNQLNEMSDSALKSLQEGEIKVENDRKEKELLKYKENEKQAITHWNQVEQVVNKGVLSHISIPEAEKKDFFKYISQAANEDGLSQSWIDRDNLSIEQKLILDYMVFKKLDFTKLIANRSKTETAKTMRSRLAGSDKSNVHSTVSQENHNNTKNPNSVEVSLDTIT